MFQGLSKDEIGEIAHLQTMPDKNGFKTFDKDAISAVEPMIRIETEGEQFDVNRSKDIEVRSYRVRDDESMSFADKQNSRSGLPRQRSNVSLARSNSKATIKRISNRYMRD